MIWGYRYVWLPKRMAPSGPSAPSYKGPWKALAAPFCAGGPRPRRCPGSRPTWHCPAALRQTYCTPRGDFPLLLEFCSDFVLLQGSLFWLCPPKADLGVWPCHRRMVALSSRLCTWTRRAEPGAALVRTSVHKGHGQSVKGGVCGGSQSPAVLPPVTAWSDLAWASGSHVLWSGINGEVTGLGWAAKGSPRAIRK